MRSPHRVVVLSDIEMGAGDKYDDFPHTRFLADLVDGWAACDAARMDLVFNGDTLDMLKVSLRGEWPTIVNEAVALAKLERILRAHGPVFDALGRFLRRPGRMVHFVVGNHDHELFFPAVQRRIRQRIAAPGVAFPGLAMTIGDLWIEHGSQEDRMFRVDPANMFTDSEHGPVLALPWGSVVLLEVAMPVHPVLYDVDRLKPRRRVFELLPELRELVVGTFRRYWARDARAWVLREHPVKQVTWEMLSEIAYRFRTQDPDLQVGEQAYRDRVQDGPHKVAVIGHLHQASWWADVDRKLLYTGCLRDEFPVAPDGTIGPVLPKVWAEIDLVDDRVVRSQLVEVTGPPSPPGQAPPSLDALRERLTPLLLGGQA